MSDLTQLKERLERLAARGEDPGVESLLESLGRKGEIPARRHRPLVTAAIAFVAVVAITSAAVMVSRRDHASTPPSAVRTPAAISTRSLWVAPSEPALISPTDGWICGNPLRHTTDGGRSWRSISVHVPATHTNSCAFRPGGRAWVATADLVHPPTVVRLDSGADATQTRANLPGARPGAIVVSMSFPSDALGWALTTVNASNPPRDDLFATVDGGRHWRLLDAGTQITGSLRFTSTSRGWAVAGAALARTDDGGRTWTPIAFPAPPKVGNDPVKLASVSVFGDQIVIDGTRFDRDLRRTVPFIAVSSDLGRSWSLRTLSGDVAQAAAFAFHGHMSAFVPVDAAHWYVLLGALWFTDDAGRSWRRLDGPAGAFIGSGISFATPELGWASTCTSHTERCDPVVARTTDGGQTWTKLAQL